ncbi:Cytidylate kinase [[Clostridium] ultunense Esp]|uniref:Cytidylate kinase n=1 Tax=[Clostridium] ultunense Esp TaxID=1288971 RepID=M1Z3R8_9FIRM|nr:(d)CMP kinase [Schnuerera ultunensis]CCQ92676.1 Cytidylate kinase [[Clostridium] ultunense Esp]SHD77113.1 cytidylate kinase [[Clostridium] ultunense Esp]
MVNRRLIIAVDGPAGAGKSTIAKRIAEILELEYIDTGAMYRALTLKVIRAGIDPEDTENILKLMETTSIYFKDNHIYLDGTTVDNEIRKKIVNNNVSVISKIKEVRENMVHLQRSLAESSNLIMDGRDIGTVVLPNANYKFFITASIEERGRRRYKELLEKEEKNISYEQILTEIKNRDRIDSTRKIAPLKKSLDAYEIDTTEKTVEECVEEILRIIEGG